MKPPRRARRANEICFASVFPVIFMNGLHVVDISDPRHPFVIAKNLDLWGVHDLSLIGDYAYTALSRYESDFNGLGVLDISNPASPTLVTLPLYQYPANGLAISGNYAYLAQGRLRIYDITNQTAPALVSHQISFVRQYDLSELQRSLTRSM